jgi:hypothetical protein
MYQHDPLTYIKNRKRGKIKTTEINEGVESGKDK